MTPQEFQQFREKYLYNYKEMAQLLRASVIQVMKWEAGEIPIPDDKAHIINVIWRNYESKPMTPRQIREVRDLGRSLQGGNMFDTKQEALEFLQHQKTAT